MTFSFNTLRDYLWYQFGIAPETIRLDTHFRQDLHLTDTDIKSILRHVSYSMGVRFPIDTVQHLTDVFDLMVYVLLRSLEESDTANYFGEPDGPIDGIANKDFLLFGQLICQQPNLN